MMPNYLERGRHSYAMAHLTTRTGYEQLVERLNRFPQGAPPSDLLYAILKLLFSEGDLAQLAQTVRGKWK